MQTCIWPSRVVPEKGPLSGCVCESVCSAEIYFKVKSQNILEAVSVLPKFLTYYGKTCNY